MSTKLKLKLIREHRGLSLTETLLVLGVIALVAVIAYQGYGMAVGNVKTSGDARNIVQLVSGITKTFTGTGDYAQVTQANVVNAKLVPTGFRVSQPNNRIITSFGGNIYITNNGTQYAIAVTSVPASSCMDMLQALASIATDLYSMQNPANPDTAPNLFPKPNPNTASKSESSPIFNHANAISGCSSGPLPDAPRMLVLYSK